MKWGDVFRAAVKKAKELRAQNPGLSVSDSTREAYKTPEIQKMREEYHRNKVTPSKTKAKPKAKSSV